jgi:hypothetical protein
VLFTSFPFLSVNTSVNIWTINFVNFRTIWGVINNSEEMETSRTSIGIQGNNRFDELINNLIKDKGRLKVEKIESDEVGGLKIFLSDDYILEAFPDSSEDDEESEHWRFFDRKDKSPQFCCYRKRT